jgi:hypothetical protein
MQLDETLDRGEQAVAQATLVGATGAGGDQVDITLAHRLAVFGKGHTPLRALAFGKVLALASAKPSPSNRGMTGSPDRTASGSRAGRPCRARSGCLWSSRAAASRVTPGISTALLRSRCTSSGMGRTGGLEILWRRARPAPWCRTCGHPRPPCARCSGSVTSPASNTMRATMPSR